MHTAPEQASSPSPSLLLRLDQVTLPSSRDARQILLEDVNWQVHQGDFWALGGLEGSGKSDLLLLAAGILPPAAGHVRLFGQAGATPDARDRLRVGLVFDGGQLLSHLTIAENIALPICYHQDCYLEDCRDRVESLLKFTELESAATHFPGQVNPNRRQRAGLARALALQPELLLVDNPLSGLDPLQTAWWQRRLCRLAEGDPVMDGRPVTLVVAGTDPRPWRSTARQFAILKLGRFITMDQANPAMAADLLLEQLIGGDDR